MKETEKIMRDPEERLAEKGFDIRRVLPDREKEGVLIILKLPVTVRDGVEMKERSDGRVRARVLEEDIGGVELR